MEALKKIKSTWPIIVAGFGGGFIAGIIDIIANEDAAFTDKIAHHLSNRLDINIGGFWPLIVVALISGFICWGLDTSTKKQALVQGLSILSMLTVITPYKNQGIKSQPVDSVSQTLISVEQQLFVLTKQQNTIKSNALINENEWISSTKPEVSFSSFFNNSIKINPVGYNLKKGDRVEVLDCYDTPFRNYRYVQIKYLHDDNVEKGWIWSGKSPNYWVAVKPDSENLCK